MALVPRSFLLLLVRHLFLEAMHLFLLASFLQFAHGVTMLLVDGPASQVFGFARQVRRKLGGSTSGRGLSCQRTTAGPCLTDLVSPEGPVRPWDRLPHGRVGASEFSSRRWSQTSNMSRYHPIQPRSSPQAEDFAQDPELFSLGYWVSWGLLHTGTQPFATYELRKSPSR